jgi:hypothetical protein
VRVIDAIQRPDVIDGSKWVVLMPKRRILCQMFVIRDDPEGRKMRWCDNAEEVLLSLRRLYEECEIIDPPCDVAPRGIHRRTVP